MHPTSLRLLALTTAILTLATPTLSRVGKDASGINCYGHECDWECDQKSCSQAFADIVAGTGVSETQEYKDGAYVACLPDIIGDDGLCGIIHGLGTQTTNGTNLKAVVQDLANHCGECGQAPIHRDDGNKLAGGWFQIEKVDSAAVCEAAKDIGALALCPQS